MKDNSINKILVVAESIDVEDSSGTKGRVALIKNLYKAGFEVLVYHYTRKEIQIDDIPCVGIKENRRSLLFFLSRMERQIRYKTGWKLNKYVEQLFGFSFTLFNDRNSILARLKKKMDFEPDLVLTLRKGGSFRPHHALLKIPEWHSRWMAYIHDPYPMYLYPPPFAWPEPGSMKKWQFVNEISEKANYSAFPSKLLMNWMGGYFSNFQKNGVVIPHQIDFEEILPGKLPDFFNPEKFNLLHAGNLLGPRNPVFLIEAYMRFLEENPDAKIDAKLIFVGDSSAHSLKIQEYKNAISKDYLIIQPYLEYRMVQAMQNKAQINIILEAKSQISPFLPGKFPHCAKANKIILHLGPEMSETRRLLGDEYKYWAEIDEIEKIQSILSDLYFKWKKDRLSLKLNKPELIEYLSKDNLLSIIQGMS